jgi:hypothetical protein
MRAVTDVRVYVCVARVPAGFSTRASSQIRDAMYSSRGRSSMRPHIGQCLGVCVCARMSSRFSLRSAVVAIRKLAFTE